MNKSIRFFVLHNPLLCEIFFLLRGKKVYRKKIDRKIKKLSFEKYEKKEHLTDVIISLTTYGERLYELQYTLYSLIDQTVKPEMIIVNLAKKDFENIPENLRIFENYGVVFKVTEDFRSYKKLIPTLIAYPNKYIITSDDDIYYPRKWLETLWAGHLEEPDCIVCHLTQKIEYDNKHILPYSFWKYNSKETPPVFNNSILGVGGTVFPPTLLYSDITNSELFMKLSPFADDLWFYFMAILKGTRIKQLPKPFINVRYVNPYREYGLVRGETLTQINVGQDRNDVQFRAIMNHYGINEQEFIQFLQSKKDLDFIKNN